ncbi:MAG TPA: zinc-binding dehydrogenase, partial [Candidatus Binatus sp.]|nr:zinc-binding dehydrogenase [Candidatus Binatus sp.]
QLVKSFDHQQDALRMLACLLEAPKRAVLKQVPIPRVGPGEVLVKLNVAGICGTDVEKLDGGLGPGGILGHEVSGTVEKVGENARGINTDERVVAHHHVPCYKCRYCSMGDHTMCDFFKKTNFDPCGLAEYFRVPAENVERGAVIPIPSGLGFESAALAEPTACCLRAIKSIGVNKDDAALVVGLGPTGLTHVQLLRHYGAKVIIGLDVSQTRLEMAKRLGASFTIDPSKEDVDSLVKEETGTGVDLAIVAAGSPRAFATAVSSVRKGGRICLFGAPPIGSKYVLDLHDAFTRQIKIVPSYSCIEPEIKETLQLMSQEKIDVSRLITNRYPLNRSVEALDNARNPASGVKTVITTSA